MNLTDELEKSFAHEPAHRPVEQQLAAGRRLVRRRRTVTGAAALAVVAVLGAGYAVVGSGDDKASDPPIADQKQPTDDPVDDDLKLQDWGVSVSRDGELLTAPGVQVIESVPNPEGYGPPGKTYGVAYDRDGTTNWVLIDPSGGSHEVAFQSFPTFDYWLRDQVAMQRGEPLLELVRFGEGEELLPRAGVEILQQTGEINIGPRFAGPNDRTAVAEVMYDNQRWYVLARDLADSGIQYFPTAASVSTPTLEEFLPYAKDSYTNGTGLR